jgi:hypothetical protein
MTEIFLEEREDIARTEQPNKKPRKSSEGRRLSRSISKKENDERRR